MAFAHAMIAIKDDIAGGFEKVAGTEPIKLLGGDAFSDIKVVRLKCFLNRDLGLFDESIDFLAVFFGEFNFDELCKILLVGSSFFFRYF